MRLFRRIFPKHQPRNIPIYIFCYHKGGSKLLSKIFRQICVVKNWKYQVLVGNQSRLTETTDVVLFAHSQIDLFNITKPYIGVHVIRDPRDIVVSGYLYHLRTNEEWCINSDFSSKPPILFPKVPYSKQHQSENWKRKYLEGLNGVSYQENLLSMSQRDGLHFEMNHYGAWTIENMRNWNYSRDNILEIKFEEIMSNYDDTFHLLFEHLGFSISEIEMGINIASHHDLGRKSTEEIRKMDHVSSKNTTKWKKYFELEHKRAFIRRFNNVLVELGYEKDNNW